MAWRYDEIDTGGRWNLTGVNGRETSSASLRQQIKSLHHQDHQCLDRQNQTTHGSDTGGGAVKAAPKSLPSQQKEQRRHKKISATPRNAIKILVVASAVTKSSMLQSKISDIEKIKSKTSQQAKPSTQRQQNQHCSSGKLVPSKRDWRDPTARSALLQ